MWAIQKTWQRKSHHVAHCNVHQHKAQHKGGNYPSKCDCAVWLFGCIFASRRIVTKNGCTVACVSNGINNVLRVASVLANHGVGKQTNIDGLNTIYFCNGLFHVGGASRASHASNVKLCIHFSSWHSSRLYLDILL